jgi:hypothetical protein
MSLSATKLSLAAAALALLSCGDGDVVNGFATYGSAQIQGFVTGADGAPVANAEVSASFGPDAFGLGGRTDSRGLYGITAVSPLPLDQPPFDDSVIPCRITVGEASVDTLVPVRFVAKAQTVTPVTVNLVLPEP